MINGKKVLGIILICVSSFLIVYLSIQAHDYIKEASRQREILRQRKVAWLELKNKLTREIGNYKGEAGIVVKDLQTNWELSYNKDKAFPSASLVKIPIMAACYAASDEGLLKLDSEARLKDGDKIGGSGILKSTQSGTSFSIEELIGFMITYSDNTATHMLTNILGIEYIENAFKRFGMNNTNLARRVADYRLRDKGIENYTTAGDMAVILEKIYRNKLVNKDISGRCLSALKTQHYNDRIPKYLPSNITCAHKTGLEKNVCHDVGIVFTPKGDFIIVALTGHNNSGAAISKKFIAKAAFVTYQYFDSL